uniref:transposase n=1 Tax=Sphingobacterium zhuxiongii TaxID=2662364 RepID=UPI0021D14380|nr:transposase [Sphingobacterium sp. dk4302]
MIFPQNVSAHLSIDETCLSHGELYTVVTNKETRGKKGTIVAILNGTKSENIIPILQKIPQRLRNKVQEITLDLAGNMGLIAKRCFPNAVQVIDRFHVQQLATEALQEIRIKHRWQAIDDENQAIDQARKNKETFFRKSYPTMTPSNSYLQEADTCFIKVNINGLPSKEKGLLYYLSDIPILKRRTGYPKNSLGYSTPP